MYTLVGGHTTHVYCVYMCTVCTCVLFVQNITRTYIPSLKLVSFSVVSWSLDLRGADNSLASDRSSALALSISFSLLSRRSAKVKMISALCGEEGGGVVRGEWERGEEVGGWESGEEVGGWESGEEVGG